MGGEVIVIEVADEGDGVPEEKRDLIFEEFRRLEGGDSAEDGITGSPSEAGA